MDPAEFASAGNFTTAHCVLSCHCHATTVSASSRYCKVAFCVRRRCNLTTTCVCSRCTKKTACYSRRQTMECSSRRSCQSRPYCRCFLPTKRRRLHTFTLPTLCLAEEMRTASKSENSISSRCYMMLSSSFYERVVSGSTCPRNISLNIFKKREYYFRRMTSALKCILPHCLITLLAVYCLFLFRSLLWRPIHSLTVCSIPSLVRKCSGGWGVVVTNLSVSR